MGLQSAGIILLVTGAGGALGAAVLRDSGAGNSWREQVANLPSLADPDPNVRRRWYALIQGSGTVAMITRRRFPRRSRRGIPGITYVPSAMLRPRDGVAVLRLLQR